MKSIIRLAMVFMLFITTARISAQHVFPQAMAVCKNGILTGRYERIIRPGDEITNSRPAVISLEDAKSIFTINAIDLDTTKNFLKINIKSYNLEILEQGDTTIINGKTDLLSDEMKTRLGKIKSGAKIYFMGIRATYPDGGFRGILPLEFIVI